MKLSKIKEKISKIDDPNATATIIHYNSYVKCTYLFIKEGKRRRKTTSYSFLDFDIPANLTSCTILKWDEGSNNGFGLKYINYYDERTN